jgi:GntR family transcriptional regulator
MRSGPHIKESRKDENDGGREGALGFRPLYRQVRDVLVKRIVDGVLRPGETLPSETDIATDLRVSQGTVRKALNDLVEENFVVRRQGKGTFVARHDEERILFQFFKLTPDNGISEFPDSRILSVTVQSADAGAAEALSLRTGSRVVRIERLRSLAGRICILERIALPRALFPAIEKRDLPNNLYELYRSVFGVTVVRAQERLKAVAAAKRDAKALGLRPGVPLLSIDRRAFAADGRPVEQRLSLCHTDILHYFSDLS